MKRIAIRPYDMQLQLCVSHKDFAKHYEELSGNKYSDESMGVCYSKGKTLLVGVFSGGLVTLVHELMHVVLDVAEYVGLHTTDQEALCYLIDDLMGECLKAYPQLRTAT